jgi:hypothetical protein
VREISTAQIMELMYVLHVSQERALRNQVPYHALHALQDLFFHLERANASRALLVLPHLREVKMHALSALPGCTAAQKTMCVSHAKGELI